MKATRLVVFAVTAVVLAAAPARAAANKEHQQLMAEIRMLQEQQQQLQQLLGNLSDALKGVSTKIDDQTAAIWRSKTGAERIAIANGMITSETRANHPSAASATAPIPSAHHADMPKRRTS